MRRLSVLPLTALALAAPAAASAQSWSAPEPVGVAAAQPRTPQLGFGTGDRGVASLGFGAAATAVVGLPAGAARAVGSVEDGPLPYAGTRTVSLRRAPTNTAGTFRLGYSFGRSDTLAIGPARTLRTVGLRPGEAELAVSPNGHAVIAFAEERGGGTRVFLAVRRAGAPRFGAPQVVRGRGSARSLAVSVNRQGRWVLAYALGDGSRRTVEARIGTSAGRVGPVQTIGRQLGVARLDAEVAPSGRATVAWTTHDGGEEQDVPTQLRTNVAPAGRPTFAGQVVVDRAAPGAVFTEPTPPRLAAAPDGTTLVGYTLSGRVVGGDALTPAKVSVQDRDARFGAPQLLSADGVVGEVAARADGTFAVPYVEGAPLEPAASRLLVALGRTAFVAEPVADDALVESAAAFSPGGEPIVLFVRAGGDAALSTRRG